MRSTHDHEDRGRYWLTDAVGGHDNVFMVMSRPNSNVYYCFIKLSGISSHLDRHIHNSKDLFIASEAITAFSSHPAEVSLA